MKFKSPIYDTGIEEGNEKVLHYVQITPTRSMHISSFTLYDTAQCASTHATEQCMSLKGSSIVVLETGSQKTNPCMFHRAIDSPLELSFTVGYMPLHWIISRTSYQDPKYNTVC